MEDINDIWNTIKKAVSESSGKIMGKDEIPQRNSWFDEECQIILEDKKKAYIKMISGNSRQHKLFRQKKKEYCLNQSWHKWKLLIVTMKQRNFVKK